MIKNQIKLAYGAIFDFIFQIEPARVVGRIHVDIISHV